jgi:replicative DNA helicase
MSAAQLDFALDRELPQSPDAERAVLGSILINNNAFYRVISIIDAADFYKDGNRTIFATMRLLAEQSRPIDILTVKEELARHVQLDQVGGYAYISHLVDVVPDVANVERYAGIIKEKSTLRRLIVMGNSVMLAALDAPSEPGAVLHLAERQLYSISEGNASRGFIGLDRITRGNMTAIEQIHSAGKLLTGVPTGYDRFDEYTSGFQPQDLIILAARPSMGKTTLLMNLAENISLPGRDGNPRTAAQRLHSVGVFSMEMSKEQIGLRILSSDANVPNHLIRSGLLSERNWRDLADAAQRLAKGKIFVDDTPALDPLELRARARRLQQEVGGLDLIGVDYLQLMATKGRIESRQQEVSQISRGLKATAKELNVPILALSQLSRRPEQRTGDHRPQLSDLRESGAIEQDADLVCFIYRDEVYNKETEDKGIAEIIIGKQRNGPIGDFKLVFRPDITKFFNYEPQPDYVPADEQWSLR